MYIELLKMKEHDQRIKLETNDSLKNNKYSVPTILIRASLFFTIFIVIICCIFIFNMLSKIKDATREPLYNHNNNYQEKNINADFNEKIDMKNYSIICDEMRLNNFYNINNNIVQPLDGYKYVTFHFILDNYSYQTLFFNDEIYIKYDDKMTLSQIDYFKDNLLGIIMPNEKKEGYYTFLIEENVKEYIIQIGNNISINIEEEEIKNELY